MTASGGRGAVRAVRPPGRREESAAAGLQAGLRRAGERGGGRDQAGRRACRATGGSQARRWTGLAAICVRGGFVLWKKIAVG